MKLRSSKAVAITADSNEVAARLLETVEDITTFSCLAGHHT
jgi:hypothetical protein